MTDKKIDINEYSDNFPASEKYYVEGSAPDIQVPSRMIKQTPTKLNDTAQINGPIYVYDTTGPYTDPDYKIDVSLGCRFEKFNSSFHASNLTIWSQSL